jgi:hypothetical protein
MPARPRLAVVLGVIAAELNAALCLAEEAAIELVEHHGPG